MPNYRRDLTPGSTYFFTVVLRDRTSRLLIERIENLRGAVREIRRQAPFEIVAWVVLPEHMHAIWKLPDGDADYAGRWRMIKARFSRQLSPSESSPDSLVRRGEKGIWQRRFWEHRIRNECDLQTHFDYVHFNPVKHGHCDRVVDWPYSTFHRWLAKGHYTMDWGMSESAFQGRFGE